MKLVQSPPNLGGILQIALLRTEQVADLSIVDGLQTITLIASEEWLVVDILDEGSSFAIEPSSDFNGTIYKVSIGCRFPKITEETNTELDKFIGKDSLAVLMDNNENVWMFGSPDDPLRLIFKGDSGNQATDLNNYDIKLTGISLKIPTKADPAPLYS